MTNSILSTSQAPIFIVGLPRSGSTLWSKVLDANPHLRLFAECHFLTLWRKDFRHLLQHSIGNLNSIENKHKLVDILFSDPPVQSLQHGRWYWNQIRELESSGLKDAILRRLLQSNQCNIGQIFKIIVEESIKCCGPDKRAIVKFPVHPYYLEQLRTWWPDSKIIHITRDPRSIAASKTSDPNSVAKLSTKYPWAKWLIPFLNRYYTIAQYNLASRAHTRQHSSKNYRLFFYEDLITEPDKTIAQLCEFCEITFNEAMLNPAAGQASSITGEKTSGFDPNRTKGWEKSLSPFESKLIARISARSMRRFGYKPTQ